MVSESVEAAGVFGIDFVGGLIVRLGVLTQCSDFYSWVDSGRSRLTAIDPKLPLAKGS